MDRITGSGDEQESVVVRKGESGWVVGDEEVSDLTSAMVLADLFAAERSSAGGQPDETEDRPPVSDTQSERQRAGGGEKAPEPRAGRQRDAGRKLDPSHVPPAARATTESGALKEPSTAGPGAAGPIAAEPATDPGTQGPDTQGSGDTGSGTTGFGAPMATPVPGAPAVGAHEEDEAARLAVTVQQLEHALASRVRVEQAIGVLAERHRLRPRDAFNLLRGAARSRGRRVTDIAGDVVASTANPLLRLPEELSRTIPPPQRRGRSGRRGRHEEEPQRN